jgi:NAD(P)-dependent dehydrogenase (short-subunit alcohol dehydrogenase family)
VWTSDDLRDQSGRVVVITGASSGIGLVTANKLIEKGATLIAAVRNVAKARAVLNPKAQIQELDLADLDSVKRFANNLNRSIDVLVNNAGVMAIPLSRTAQGFEMQIGTNHFGHFALTGLLLDKIQDRVITVSSTAHKMGRMRFADINWNKTYKPWLAYGQSKLANLLFTAELDKRLSDSGSKVKAIAVHPGYSNTALQGKSEKKTQDFFMKLANKYLAQSDLQGAWPTLYAISEDIPGNSFVGPDGFAEIKGYPKLVGRTKAAQNMKDANTLWEISEKLTGIKYNF